MKKALGLLVVVLALCIGITALAEENPFEGRWIEESELGSSLILKSDGSCEGYLMLLYEMKGSYTLNDSDTATLHVDSLAVASGMEGFLSERSATTKVLQKQLDGARIELNDKDTLSFLNMEMYRDESYQESEAINDGKLEGQWELKNRANALDQMMLYFAPNGVMYSAYDGKIYEKSYTFDGTTVVMGEGNNTIEAVLQEDGSLKVERAGTYVKTKAYTAQSFADIAGLYGEERGYIGGYCITPEGDLLSIYGLPGTYLEWDIYRSDLVMAGNRIGKHDDLGNRFYAMVDNGVLTQEVWTIDDNRRWVRDKNYDYPLLCTIDEITALMEFGNLLDDLPEGVAGTYFMEGESDTLVIYPDGTALWNTEEMEAKATDGGVALITEGERNCVYILKYTDDALTFTNGYDKYVFTRVGDSGADSLHDDVNITLFDLGYADDGLIIRGFAADMGEDVTNLIIPATISGQKVTEVDVDAFRGEDQIVSLTVEEGIQRIGSGAFAYCESLESVVLPENIVSMGGSVFDGCGALVSVTLPVGLTEVAGGMFSGCRKLESVVIPEGVTAIGGHAFAYCESLEELELPSTLMEIAHFAFMESGIRTLFIPEGVEYFHASMIDGMFQLERIFFPRSMKKIEDETVPGNYSHYYYFGGNYVAYVLNDKFAYGTGIDTVIVMDDYDAYGRDEMAYELLDDGTARITGWFGQTDSLVIPSAIGGIPVTVIGEKAFAGNKSFQSIIIEEGITTIEPYAFYLTDAQTLVLPSTLKSIGTNAFNGAAVRSLYIPEGVETLEARSLPSGLEEVYIPASVTNIDNHAGSGIDVGYVFEGSAGQRFASQSWANRQYYGCENYVLVEPGAITQAEDGSILRCGMTTAEYEVVTSTPEPTPTPTPVPTPTATPTFTPTLPPITYVSAASASDGADGVPLQFCGHYSMNDNCSWKDYDITADIWIYPDGYVYYRAEGAEGVLIKHGTVVFESTEGWDGPVYSMDIRYHHQEGVYFHTCDHYEYRLSEYNGKITFDGTDTACMSSAEYVGNELLDVIFVTAPPTPEPTAVPDYVVFEIPESARSKDVPEDDPAKQLLGPWHGSYFDTIYDLYYAPGGVVYGSKYDYEYGEWSHYCIGQYTVTDGIVEMTWPEGASVVSKLTMMDDPNILLLCRDEYFEMDYYIHRVAE